MNKRVLISAYTCCPNRGSEPGNGWNWIINYSKNDFDVTVVTSKRYQHIIERYQLDNPSPVKFIFIDLSLSLKLMQLPFVGDYIHYFIWLFLSRKKVVALDNDNVYAHCHHVTYSSVRFGTPLYNLKAPIILGPLGGSSKPHKSLKKYFGKYWTPEMIKDAFSIILSSVNPTISKTLKSASYLLVSNKKAQDFVERFNRNNIHQMYDAGLAEYFKMDLPVRILPEKVVNILWVGRFLPRKGLNLAIDTFIELQRIDSPFKFKLLIAGTGLLEAECKKQVQDADLQNSVVFLGALSHDKLVEYYCSSHLFLFPSLKDSCPMQVFEAMSTGLPVVSLNHQGMADQIIDGVGLKVDVGDGINYPTELAKCITKIIATESGYQKMCAMAYHHGQRQIWSTRIKHFLTEVVPSQIQLV